MLNEELAPIEKHHIVEDDMMPVEVDSRTFRPRPIITIRGEPVEIPSFDDIPDHMEIVEPIEDRSVVIWPVFTIWCAIALIVLAIANATIIAIRR